MGNKHSAFQNNDAEHLYHSFIQHYRTRYNTMKPNFPLSKQQMSAIVENMRTSCQSAEMGSKIALKFTDIVVGDDAVASICDAMQDHLSSVSSLSITGTNTAISGCFLNSILVEESALVELDLSGNGILDLSQISLKSSKLEVLSLCDCCIEDDAMANFALALIDNKTLHTLNLADNLIRTNGAEALLDVLRDNSTLCYLDLTNNSISQGTLDAIDVAIKRNRVASPKKFVRQDTRRFKERLDSNRSGTLVREKANTDVESVDMPYVGTRFDIGTFETVGRRNEMQDVMAFTSLRGRYDEDAFIVCDGHGGKEPADFCATRVPYLLSVSLDTMPIDRAITYAFNRTNDEMESWSKMRGTTVCMVVIFGDRIYTANVGDTRAVLCRNEGAMRLSTDHKPAVERARIESAGRTIEDGRVDGMLAVSRALGDSFLGDVISSEPSISSVDLAASDKFVIIACDGVWDVMNDDEAVDIVKQHDSASDAAKALVDAATDRESKDNISVMVVMLKPKVVGDGDIFGELCAQDEAEKARERRMRRKGK